MRFKYILFLAKIRHRKSSHFEHVHNGNTYRLGGSKTGVARRCQDKLVDTVPIDVRRVFKIRKRIYYKLKIVTYGNERESTLVQSVFIYRKLEITAVSSYCINGMCS